MVETADDKGSIPSVVLEKLDPKEPHSFFSPAKKIHDRSDVTAFLTSLAYSDIMTFIIQLNRAMVPRIVEKDGRKSVQTWELASESISFSKPVLQLQNLITTLETFVSEAPPDTGPRRFGNLSFRKWYTLVEERLSSLLDQFLPVEVLKFGQYVAARDSSDVKSELAAYLLGSFGSPQRLDYGTGHELSFIAFLGCIWKLGGFSDADPGVEERGIVLGIFEPYLNLIRRLIKTYTLEPAGSHGVWGLDDNSFLPYLFGSAQLSPAISEADATPIEGSIPDAPDASGATKANVVETERKRNMYFSAIGFIYDIKKGPFWEHSPMLYDISGIRGGWGKINKGMLKMYNAEVLSKFPVVQHFPFGSLFVWERDPNAVEPTITTHTASQPSRNPVDPGNSAAARALLDQGTKAPWAVANAPPLAAGGTGAPWVTGRPPPPPVGMVDGVTRAPWANQPSHRSVPPQISPALAAARSAKGTRSGHAPTLTAPKEAPDLEEDQKRKE